MNMPLLLLFVVVMCVVCSSCPPSALSTSLPSAAATPSSFAMTSSAAADDEDPRQQLQLMQCYLQAECPNAPSLPPVPAENYLDCLAKCQADERCQWFTFYVDAHVCKLLRSCPEGPTAECQEACLSGESGCDQLTAVCDQNGLWCDGPEVGFWLHVEGLEDCKEHCRQEQLCEWYNYDSSALVCLLTSSCNVTSNDTITDCPTCTAGQTECLPPGPEDFGMNRLMVVGGYPSYSQVEVIDLSGNKSLTCPQLQNGPLQYAAVGAFMKGKYAVVCSGHNEGDGCYVYSNETDTWEGMAGSLIGPEYYRAAVVLSDAQWWFTGGLDSAASDKTEILHLDADDWADATSVPFLSLPRPAYSHVLLPLNESAVIFLGGGGEDYDDLWVFNLDAREWTQLPSMPSGGGRQAPVAGLATFPDGSRQLVVAGGVDDASTVIFNFDSNGWRSLGDGTTGNLYFDIYYAAVVQYRDTFLVVGGRSNQIGSYLNTIFEFDPANEEWIQREEYLSEKKSQIAAFLVPDDYVKCADA